MTDPIRSDKAGYHAQARSSFFARVFGWDLDAMHGRSGFWPVSESGELVLDASTEELTAGMPALTGEGRDWIKVRSIAEVGERIESQGGRLLFPGLSIPGVGQLVYCQDNEGNPFGILEPTGVFEADVTTLTLDE